MENYTKDMLNLKMQEEPLRYPMISLENGIKKEKSKVLEQMETIEDISSPIYYNKNQKNNTSMLVSHHPGKRRIWKNKLNTLENDIQIMNSLKILDQVLTLRGKDLKPFWTQQSKENSEKLWLPTRTDFPDLDLTSLNGLFPSTPMGKSWFSMIVTNPQKKNLLETSSQSSPYSHLESMDSENIKNPSIIKSKLKTLKLRLFPTKQENDEIYITNEVYKWYYNATLDILSRSDNIKHCSYDNQLSKTKVRDLIRKYRYTEEKIGDKFIIEDFVYDGENNEFPKPSFIDKIHNRIPRGAIYNVVQNMNSAMSNKKNGNIKSYNLKYKTSKDSNCTITFEDERYPTWINQMKGWYRYGRKKISLSEILKDIKVKNLSISIDRERKQFYLLIPVDVSWKPNGNESQVPIREKIKHPYISLDPGVRTFQTGFSDNHIVCIGEGGFKKIVSLLEKSDLLQSKMDDEISSRKRKRLRIRRLRVYHRIRCLVNDIHWKTIHFLTSNYHEILLPDFRISGMVKKKKMSKQTKRLLYMYSYNLFKNRMIYKAECNNSKIHIVDESYTSKTCTKCGFLNNHLGSNKVFECPECGMVLDRDINGARNILLKNWSALTGS